jgi:hypothetical protein
MDPQTLNTLSEIEERMFDLRGSVKVATLLESCSKYFTLHSTLE